MNEPTDDQLEVQRLHGEQHIATNTIEWWAEEMLFWRTKYLRDHPEHANFDYVQTARETEKIDPLLFL